MGYNEGIFDWGCTLYTTIGGAALVGPHSDDRGSVFFKRLEEIALSALVLRIKMRLQAGDLTLDNAWRRDLARLTEMVRVVTGRKLESGDFMFLKESFLKAWRTIPKDGLGATWVFLDDLRKLEQFLVGAKRGHCMDQANISVLKAWASALCELV